MPLPGWSAVIGPGVSEYPARSFSPPHPGTGKILRQKNASTLRAILLARIFCQPRGGFNNGVYCKGNSKHPLIVLVFWQVIKKNSV